VPMMTPTLVTPQVMGGTGFLHEPSADIYSPPHPPRPPARGGFRRAGIPRARFQRTLGGTQPRHRCCERPRCGEGDLVD